MTNLKRGFLAGFIAKAVWLMAGAGLFGMMAPLMTLMQHIILGAVLGRVYGTLVTGPRWRADAPVPAC